MPWGYKFKEALKNFLTKIYLIKNIFNPKKWPELFNFGKRGDFHRQIEFDQQLPGQITKKNWPSFRQLKYLPEVLQPQEKNKIKKLALIILLCLVASGVDIYFRAPLVPRNGGSYSEGLVGAPKFINPLYAPLNAADQDLVKLIFSGLVKIDKQQNLVPDLAETWFVSDDQKVYTFVLRKNILWQDGAPLTIDDILFTFEAIQNPEYKSPLASNFLDVTLKKVDEQSVSFTLKQPYAPFLENLTVGILPEHLWQEVTPANTLLADYNLKPIGSGPFKFDSLVKDKLGNIKTYTLTKNKKYYFQPAYLDKIDIKFYVDYKSAVTALKNHNIDGLDYLPQELKSELASRKDINYYALQLPQYTAVFFNTKNNEWLKDIKFKQALAYALNKQEIVDQALNGNAQVIEAPILPGFIGYNPNIEKFGYDPTKAGQLLDEAGYKLEPGNTFRTNKDKKELKIILTAINKGENQTTAQLIQKMWQAIGVKTDLNLVESTVIKSEIIKNRSFEALIFGEIVGVDPDPYPFWHSSQAGEAGLNLSNFINKEADKVLEEARQISEPQQRHDKYIHFQNILNQNLPALFLYTPRYIYPVSNTLKGIEAKNIASPADRFTDITNWFIKTKKSLK